MDKILWHKQAYTRPSSKDTMYCPTFRYYKDGSAYDCPTGTIQHILERGTVNDYERIIPIAFPVDIHDGSIVCFYNIENAKIVFHSEHCPLDYAAFIMQVRLNDDNAMIPMWMLQTEASIDKVHKQSLKDHIERLIRFAGKSCILHKRTITIKTSFESIEYPIYILEEQADLEIAKWLVKEDEIVLNQKIDAAISKVELEHQRENEKFITLKETVICKENLGSRDHTRYTWGEGWQEYTTTDYKETILCQKFFKGYMIEEHKYERKFTQTE